MSAFPEWWLDSALPNCFKPCTVCELLPTFVQTPVENARGGQSEEVLLPTATPCERLLEHSSVIESVKDNLRSERGRLDPLELLQRIRESQSALAALESGDLSSGPERESLDQFLAKLPELWRAGEVRPTHRQANSQPRYWRTRKDPFDGVWPELLIWLQADPEITAKSLLERLHKEYPGQFSEGQLRTLQRRIRDWRRVMARELVYVCLDEKDAADQTMVIGAATAG